MYPKCEQVTQMNSLASLIVPQACKHFTNPQVSTHLGSNWPINLTIYVVKLQMSNSQSPCSFKLCGHSIVKQCQPLPTSITRSWED